MSFAAKYTTTIAVSLLLLLTCGGAFGQDPLRFRVKFSREYSRERRSGDLYVIISDDPTGEPRLRLDEMPPRAFVLRCPVRDLGPDEELVIDGHCRCFPTSLDRMPAGLRAVQALFDVSATDSDLARADGNGRSRPVRLHLDPSKSGEIELVIDTEIQRRELTDIARVQYRKIELRNVGRSTESRFFCNVAVVLPASHGRDKQRKYPVQYWVPGLGESSRSALHFFQSRGIFSPRVDASGRAEEFIYVLASAAGRHGHHGWFDSPVNGPCSRAFFEEILPVIEAEFPIRAEANSRFLVGHGMGGLGALNLLVDHPETFGGAWALAPYAPDVSAFFGVDLGLRPLPNFYFVEGGAERSLPRLGGHALDGFRAEASLEDVIGTGNLFQCFEAMWSPQADERRARSLFDRATGTIDAEVASAWRSADLVRRIEAMGPRAAALLDGKIHLVAGATDDVSVNLSTMRFKDFLASKGIAAAAEIVPECDHVGLNGPAVHKRIQDAIEERWSALGGAGR